MSEILSRRDLQFLLYEWLDTERLTDRPKFADQSRDTYDDILELAERVATDRFAPHNAKADANEPFTCICGNTCHDRRINRSTAGTPTKTHSGCVRTSMSTAEGLFWSR